MGGAAILAAGLTAIPASQALHDDPEVQDAAWYAHIAEDALLVKGRAIDQSLHLDYQRRLAGLSPEDRNRDPYRLEWAPARGRAFDVAYRNRYGATIRGHLWAPPVPFTDPVTGEASTGPFPVVAILEGGGVSEDRFWWAGQGLAESGYIALTFDVQGQGRSDVRPDPEETWCDPAGDWREPQEAGFREQGECAGVPPPIPLVDGVNATAGLLALGHIDAASIQNVYMSFAPNFVFGALDAVTWLLSEGNPVSAEVDATRIGLAGHSAGSFGATVAAQADPLHRIAAAVGWDGYGLLVDTAEPPRFSIELSVPTMLQASEQQEASPPKLWPDPDPWPPVKNALTLRDAGVDVFMLHPRASTHNEWQYIPWPSTLSEYFGGATRDGRIVAMYYTLAWFDRYLKGIETAHVRGDEGTQRLDAIRRLTARTFDGSADRTSIGVGAYDPDTDANVPYTIDGENVGDHLSLPKPSFAATADHVCEDLKQGC